VALIDDFKARFIEFETATVDTYLPILEPVYPAYYALSYTASAVTKEATLNLLAHLLVMETSTSSASVKDVQSKSVGSVSVSYANATQAGGELFDFFNSTKYGQRFMLLTRNRYGGMAV